VTYLGWNGKMEKEYGWFLSKKKYGAADYPAAIAQFFGGDTVAGPPPDKLLGKEYPKKLAKWNDKTKKNRAVAFCNAITVKYLSEACGAWFS
jgi:hypothetical protein